MMRCQSIVGLCSECFRQDCLIIDKIIASDLPGIVAVHFDDFREVIIDGIKGEILIFAPGYCFFKGFTGAAGPEDELVAGGAHLLKVFD